MDGIDERLRQKFDLDAPPLALDEVRRASGSSHQLSATPWGSHRKIVAGICVLLVLVAGGYAIAGLTPSDSAQRVATEPNEPEDSGTTVPVRAAEDGDWSTVLTVTPNEGRAVLRDVVTGAEVRGAFKPKEFGGFAIAGAGATSDGRLAMWSGPVVVVTDNGNEFKTAVPTVEAPSGALPEITVSLTESGEVYWAVQGRTMVGQPQIWRINYRSGEVLSTFSLDQAESVRAVDVLSDGSLVLANADEPARFHVASDSGDIRTVDGELLAVYDTGVLYQACGPAPQQTCALLTFNSISGETVEVSFDISRVLTFRSLSEPEIPGSFTQFRAQSADRRLIAVGALERSEEEVQDPEVDVVIVDLQTMTGDVAEIAVEQPFQVFWNCSSADFLVRDSTGFVSSSGTRYDDEVPETEFIIDVGPCV